MTTATPTCDACDNARQHPGSVRFNANCDHCKARALANDAEFRKAVKAGQMPPRYRMALAQFFPGRDAEGHRMVRAWVR